MLVRRLAVASAYTDNFARSAKAIQRCSSRLSRLSVQRRDPLRHEFGGSGQYLPVKFPKRLTAACA